LRSTLLGGKGRGGRARLEALQYDTLDGTWNVVYATQATLNTDHGAQADRAAGSTTLPFSILIKIDAGAQSTRRQVQS